MCCIYASIPETIISVDSRLGNELGTSRGVTVTDPTVFAIIIVVVLLRLSNSLGGWCYHKYFLC